MPGGLEKGGDGPEEVFPRPGPHACMDVTGIAETRVNFPGYVPRICGGGHGWVQPTKRLH
ncbi:protein of unknown function [Rhodovastum atsumiense]|nr:protein of unknown function [Rhodovastum atsumiense]